MNLLTLSSFPVENYCPLNDDDDTDFGKSNLKIKFDEIAC